ncbi:hypothetical protein Psch_02445 [Pelotomaculum schinkii]|uniref:Uncharacterized protein n=1 Tax=Pelotomaculum schinkii TaxID=78350 RepID=A0A4Y7R8Y4_9FIRM|nr:hypothetical protein Psch_02445 [Pelotomaculum schinkii]
MLHIVQYSFTVVLFFSLDVLQCLTNLRICRFKDASVVAAGYKFFGHQHVCAECGVFLVYHSGKFLVLHRLGLLLYALISGSVGLLPLQKLIDGIVVLLFLRHVLVEKLYKLRVTGLLGVIGIFLDVLLCGSALVPETGIEPVRGLIPAGF